MKLPEPLFTGRLLRRYKRFLADIRLDSGEDITAHCANPGSMMGVAVEGARSWVSFHPDAKRKLPYSWRLVEIDDVLIPIDTTNANAIVNEALDRDAIPALAGYGSRRREVPYGDRSRVDFLLEDPAKPPCYLEVKNVHLSRNPGVAEFPDSVTARGARHLRDLAAICQRGARAVLLFVVQRSDCAAFQLAGDLDPAYRDAYLAAAAAGVEFLCYDCAVTTAEVILRRPVSFISAS